MSEEIRDDQKITCQICGQPCHVIASHIMKDHPEIYEQVKNNLTRQPECTDKSFDSRVLKAVQNYYQSEYPIAPLYSTLAIERMASKKKQVVSKSQVKSVSVDTGMIKKSMAEVFNLAGTINTKFADRKTPITIDVMKKGHEFEYLVPDIDYDYLWNIDLLKTIIMAVENKMPSYLWGLAGVGKSTAFMQYCARTNKPLIRVQHTGDMESSQVTGSMHANEQGTYFNPGPLPLAMKHGFFYLADEYDFAFPQVLSVYQPVLENQPLYIKEASDDWRVNKPHPNFYMAATGNTNGAGDETGLFNGTNMQNAANYERFSVVEEVKHLDKDKEIAMLCQKTSLPQKHIMPIVAYATLIREAFEGGKITNTAGQRVTFHIAKIYMLKGDYIVATKLAFANRLPSNCARVALELAQRAFGDSSDQSSDRPKSNFVMNTF